MNNPKNELDAVEKEINETKARLRKAKAELSEAKAELSEAKAELSEAKAERRDAKASLDKAIEDGDIKRKDRLEEYILNIQGQISNIQGQISNIQGQISNIQGQISNIQGQISNIQGQISNIEGQIMELQKKENRLADISIQIPLSSLRISKNVEVTEKCQKTSSTFCSTAPSGFGFLPTSVRFDPTYYKLEHSLHCRLVPTDEEVSQAPRLRLYGEKMGLQTWGETESGEVHQQFSAVECMYKGVQDNGQTKLSSRGLSDGIAAPASYEDSHHCFGNYILSDIEHKSAASSAMPAVAQAAVTATNIAMKLLSDGVPSSECLVPVIGNTGLSFVAGVTIVLDESFPTYIPLSKHLDLSDPVERQIASAYIAKASAHCEKLYELLQNIKPSSFVLAPLRLDVDGTYYIKTLSPDVYKRGLGLFAVNHADHRDIEKGIHHMIESLNLVYASPESRPFAEYPLSIRTPDKQSDECYQLIYRDLTKLGFRIGAPNRITNEAVYDLYVKALTEAVESIHRAGVIHVDLYLSNVMWLHNEHAGVVEIKIIDWDASHCLDERKFVENVNSALIEYIGRENLHFGVEHDRLYLAVLSLDKDKYSTQWQHLASNQKGMIDSTFRELLAVVLFSERAV